MGSLGCNDGEGAPSSRPPLNLATPSPPPWCPDLRIPLCDAPLLPVDDFQLQPTDCFFGQFNRPRELARMYERIERAATEAGQALYLWTAKNGLDRLDHLGSGQA